MILNDINKYQQKMNLKEKIQYINSFKKCLKDKLIKEFSLFEIDYPLTSNRNFYLQSNPKTKRLISFDTFDRDEYVYFLSDLSIWLKEKINDLELEIRQGFIINNKKINRDNFSYSSLEEEYFTIEFLINEQNIHDEYFFEKISKDIIDAINSTILEIGENIFKNKKIEWKRIKKASYKKISKLYPFKKNVIDDYVKKYGNAIVSDYSCEYIDDRERFNPFKEGDNSLIFLIVNKISKSINSMIKIFVRPDFETLKKNCVVNDIKLIDEEKLRMLYSKRSVNIEINLTNILIYLFDEFSSCESSNSCEVNKIYDLFKQKGIKVM